MKLWIQCIYLYFPGGNTACVWKVFSFLSPHTQMQGEITSQKFLHPPPGLFPEMLWHTGQNQGQR